MKSSDSVKFPFQKRALSAAGPWLELAQAVLFLSFGILTLANGSLAFRFLQGTASAGLAIAGITRLVQMLSAEKKAAAFLSAAGFAALAVLMAVSPSFLPFLRRCCLAFGLLSVVWPGEPSPFSAGRKIWKANSETALPRCCRWPLASP